MNYEELAQKIVKELYKAQNDRKVYEYTMYYWEDETTKELAKILEKIMEQKSAMRTD